MRGQHTPGTSAERGPSTRLQVTALHENAMLGRLTALLGQHDVDHFSYQVGENGRVHAVIGVRGGTWQVDRVAARTRRLVGVLDVLAEPTHRP